MRITRKNTEDIAGEAWRARVLQLRLGTKNWAQRRDEGNACVFAVLPASVAAGGPIKANAAYSAAAQSLRFHCRPLPVDADATSTKCRALREPGQSAAVGLIRARESALIPRTDGALAPAEGRAPGARNVAS